MVVSPTGNPKGSAIGAQNCAVLAVPPKWNRPSSKSVQASLPPRPPGLPLPSTKRQAKSLMASEMGCVSAKLSEAGTPPMNGNISSQTSGVGFSPSGFSTMTSRSGRTAGSEGSQLKAFRPTGRRLGPGFPSITMVKRNPTGRSKIGTPSLNSTGSTRWSSGRATPTKLTSAPGRGVSVGVSVIVGVRVIVGVWVRVGVCVRVGVAPPCVRQRRRRRLRRANRSRRGRWCGAGGRCGRRTRPGGRAGCCSGRRDGGKRAGTNVDQHLGHQASVSLDVENLCADQGNSIRKCLDR